MKTKEKIINTSKRLFMKYGYNSVSMKDIADKVDISKPALYHHFSGKEDLYFGILKKANDNFNDRISKIINKDIKPREKIKEVLKKSIEFKMKHTNLTSLMIKKVAKKDKKIIEFIKVLRNETFEIIEPIFEECKSLKKCDKCKDTRLIAFLAMAQIQAYITDRVFIQNTDWTTDEVVEQITCSLFNE